MTVFFSTLPTVPSLPELLTTSANSFIYGYWHLHNKWLLALIPAGGSKVSRMPERFLRAACDVPEEGLPDGIHAPQPTSVAQHDAYPRWSQ
ncbi:hypothetical protein GCM10010172_09580 [Paractinoplanes ferrugineus]|uniref:Uncharacterized protein n=1 Tax=Paractinoplanes ferrugineus TaxID=113564 RepID=A0A919IYC3_9ACTN|nr:hypothetical protein Afe05nite_13630 [Actinoplanes ferrugineus]